MIVLVVAALAPLLFALMMEMRPDWTQRLVAASVFVVPGVFVGGWLSLLSILAVGSRYSDLVEQGAVRDD